MPLVGRRRWPILLAAALALVAMTAIGVIGYKSENKSTASKPGPPAAVATETAQDKDHHEVARTPEIRATNFSISNGNIIAPDGNVYIGLGINIADSEMSSVIPSASGGPITALFPGINMIRVACYNYEPPSYYQEFVTW